jgi:DNA replicative helicase MCM subunit Mcm2 (Cdc46/Mcm family)
MLSYKRYACKRCGHETEIQTNHYGECYSLGNYNRCPKCGPLPPDPKRPQAVDYPSTTWVCLDTPPQEPA